MKKIVSYDDDDDDDTDEKWLFDAARLAEALRCTVAVEKHSHIHCHYDYLYEIAGSPIDCRSHNNKMLKPNCTVDHDVTSIVRTRPQHH